MPGRLRAATAALEQRVNDELGDEITYTPATGAPSTFYAWVEFATATLNGAASASVVDAVSVEIPVAKVADPLPTARIAITILPGKVWKMASKERGLSGTTWIIRLARVAS